MSQWPPNCMALGCDALADYKVKPVKIGESIGVTSYYCAVHVREYWAPWLKKDSLEVAPKRA